MRTLKRILLSIMILVLLVVGISVIVIKTSFPKVSDAPDLDIEITPERLEHGEYIANHVALCMDCHAERDFSRFAGPVSEDLLGAGGEIFDQKMGLPGSYHSKNLTPHHLGDWTDGEIFRAITAGVSKDGKALFPIMPYPNYAQLDKEDIYAVITYLRTLDPIENDIPDSKSDFPMNLIINFIPKDPDFSERPDPTDIIAYGKYMTTLASCNDCHTPMEKGKYVEGMDFAGGNEFLLPTGGLVRSSNITPDQETGIGNWTVEEFVKKFKSYTDSTYVAHTIKKNQFNTIMPWMMYADMKTKDLEAIFYYLMSNKPIVNKVERFTTEIENM